MIHARNIIILTLAVLFAIPDSVQAFDVGDEAFLCLEDQYHPTWPEKFAFKVKVLGFNERGRVQVEVIDSYPKSGRTNEENLPVNGDLPTVSAKMLHTAKQAGVQPGARFDGKPVCTSLMK